MKNFRKILRNAGKRKCSHREGTAFSMFRFSVGNQSPTKGSNAMKRARLIESDTACWLTAVQPVLRRPTIQQFDVLVIDVHRTRTLTVNEQRIFADSFRFGFCFATCRSFFERWHCF